MFKIICPAGRIATAIMIFRYSRLPLSGPPKGLAKSGPLRELVRLSEVLLRKRNSNEMSLNIAVYIYPKRFFIILLKEILSLRCLFLS